MTSSAADPSIAHLASPPRLLNRFTAHTGRLMPSLPKEEPHHIRVTSSIQVIFRAPTRETRAPAETTDEFVQFAGRAGTRIYQARSHRTVEPSANLWRPLVGVPARYNAPPRRRTSAAVPRFRGNG